MSRRFVALVIFKEAQAYAARCARTLVAKARAFLECAPPDAATPKARDSKGPHQPN
jgi:hypothetical protein